MKLEEVRIGAPVKLKQGAWQGRNVKQEAYGIVFEIASFKERNGDGVILIRLKERQGIPYELQNGLWRTDRFIFLETYTTKTEEEEIERLMQKLYH